MRGVIASPVSDEKTLAEMLAENLYFERIPTVVRWLLFAIYAYWGLPIVAGLAGYGFGPFRALGMIAVLPIYVVIGAALAPRWQRYVAFALAFFASAVCLFQLIALGRGGLSVRVAINTGLVVVAIALGFAFASGATKIHPTQIPESSTDDMDDLDDEP